MVLESTMIGVDDSDYSRNEDFVPNRLEAQMDAVFMISQAKLRANPENHVGLLALGSLRVLSALGAGAGGGGGGGGGRLYARLHELKPGGQLQLLAGLRVAHLALRLRPERRHRARIVAFVGSPVQADEGLRQELQRLARALKKEKVSVDVVSFGREEEPANRALLTAFVDALNGGADAGAQGSHLVSVAAGPHLSDALAASPVLLGDAAAPALAALAPALAADEEHDDPELALALRISMEEEQQRQRQASTRTPDADAEPPLWTDIADMTEEEQIALAMQMSMSIHEQQQKEQKEENKEQEERKEENKEQEERKEEDKKQEEQKEDKKQEEQKEEDKEQEGGKDTAPPPPPTPTPDNDAQ